jgi:two-component system cell cycle sensor histidine kinase/response regulator CckA
LMNLVVNGRDAMPNGGKLTIGTSNAVLDDALVETRSATSTGTCVVLSVSDSGTGMDRATQARIFEPFFTTKERGKGTGLGLSTVYGIVRQSGGQIFVSSEIGKGTTFKVFLPRSDEPLQQQQSTPVEVSLHRSEVTHQLVLLVEDDPALRRIATRILRRSGYRLLVAADPREALELASLQNSRIDLLLTDVVMPEMSGIDLANRLRQEHPEMKVLLMSGYSGNAILRNSALPAGFQFLEKPFGPESLAQKVQAVLSDSSEIGDVDYESGARLLIRDSRIV